MRQGRMEIWIISQNVRELNHEQWFCHEIWGARDGAVSRALAFHQCEPGSNPGVEAICGFRG